MSEQRQLGNVPRFELKHRLDRAMEAAGLKPEDMADPIGVGVTTIRNYLSGRTHPTKGAVTAWAVRCGVDRDWLWTGEEPQEPEDGPPGLEVSRRACNVVTLDAHRTGHFARSA
jgi:transcriptional regulator with XRE-family HTH domain